MSRKHKQIHNIYVYLYGKNQREANTLQVAVTKYIKHLYSKITTVSTNKTRVYAGTPHVYTCTCSQTHTLHTHMYTHMYKNICMDLYMHIHNAGSILGEHCAC